MQIISKEASLLGGITFVLGIISNYFNNAFMDFFAPVLFFAFIIINIMLFMNKKIRFLEFINEKYYYISGCFRSVGWLMYLSVIYAFFAAAYFSINHDENMLKVIFMYLGYFITVAAPVSLIIQTVLLVKNKTAALK